MTNLLSWIVLALMVAVAGWYLWPAKTPKPVPIADVVNKVKDEVRLFYESPINLTQPAPPGSVCNTADGKNTMVLKPKSVKLTLKTVVTRSNDPNVNLKSPLAVLSFNPAYSGSYSKSNAQSMEFGLGLKEIKTAAAAPVVLEEHPLYAAARSMAQGLLDADHRKTPCVTPDTLKVTLNFDVVNKSSAGFDIQLAVFKLGDKTTLTDEFHQTLELTFDTTGSSPQFRYDR